jgi:hypothetical protein
LQISLTSCEISSLHGQVIEFWVPDEDTRIEKLQGYINSFTSSVDRLGNAPSTRTYLAELRIQMAQRMLEKMKSRAPSGALASGEAEKHLIDYLDAYPQRDIDEVQRAVRASGGDSARLDNEVFAAVKGAKDAYGPYLIVDRVRQFQRIGLIQQTPQKYDWISKVK